MKPRFSKGAASDHGWTKLFAVWSVAMGDVFAPVISVGLLGTHALNDYTAFCRDGRP
jgi:hypothetical protein